LVEVLSAALVDEGKHRLVAMIAETAMDNAVWIDLFIVRVLSV
jgi:hypothetical protein